MSKKEEDKNPTKKGSLIVKQKSVQIPVVGWLASFGWQVHSSDVVLLEWL